MMPFKNKSIFNLIEIFRTGKKQPKEEVVAKDHCETKQHHDFYCDSNISISNNEQMIKTDS